MDGMPNSLAFYGLDKLKKAFGSKVMPKRISQLLPDELAELVAHYESRATACAGLGQKRFHWSCAFGGSMYYMVIRKTYGARGALRNLGALALPPPPELIRAGTIESAPGRPKFFNLLCLMRETKI